MHKEKKANKKVFRVNISVNVFGKKAMYLGISQTFVFREFFDDVRRYASNKTEGKNINYANYNWKFE